MIWTAPISSKGQVTLPASLRQDLGVVPVEIKLCSKRERRSND